MSTTAEHFTNDSDRSIEHRIRDFRDLVEKIDGLADKKRALWLEIYEHAITDRQNAYALFSELKLVVAGKSTEHAVHGRSLAAYLERMGKANDQIIKLAELVAKAEEASEATDPNDVYSQINAQK